jgi:hypothetical protein
VANRSVERRPTEVHFLEADSEVLTPSPKSARPRAQRGVGEAPPRELWARRSHTGRDARLQIINDASAPSNDRLRAMEQLESRALGKPKETVEQTVTEPEAMTALRGMSTARSDRAAGPAPTPASRQTRGAAGERRAAASPQAHGSRAADPARAPGLTGGGGRLDEQGDRRSPFHEPEEGRIPPRSRLSDAGCAVPCGADQAV